MTGMSDEELDREWKPSGRRPQSTIARSFSAELMDIFKIENSVTDLDIQVHHRKQTVSLQSNELHLLEAQIREMEERLKRSQNRGSIPTYDGGDSARATENKTQTSRQKDESADKAKSRPGSSMTARPAPSSGDMPPTPVASEGEYEVVNRADLEDDEAARPHV
ncbi:uncharacterized protein DNG_06195 [Cephalotrichum gorgonifer]|uniref:Uncharacterized protein n=1 Tax=Cephalotrichum gorgonifer TaxID=2041049 RepID=A0AAE8SX09_9PEZI|nr:uncharacterized protein DNG_06195 [Cephalotrichum gorgonifer]